MNRSNGNLFFEKICLISAEERRMLGSEVSVIVGTVVNGDGKRAKLRGAFALALLFSLLLAWLPEPASARVHHSGYATARFYRMRSGWRGRRRRVWTASRARPRFRTAAYSRKRFVATRTWRRHARVFARTWRRHARVFARTWRRHARGFARTWGRHARVFASARLRFAPRAGFLPAVAFSGGGGGRSVVAEAMRFLGAGNVTGMRGAWCADYASMILRRTGRRPLANRTVSAALAYGPRVRQPRPGDLVVLNTRAGYAQHVGFFAGWEHGRMVMVSGNWGHRVAVSPIAPGAVAAFIGV
jgi:uncharacterized protein (TIGR02594 family)